MPSPRGIALSLTLLAGTLVLGARAADDESTPPPPTPFPAAEAAGHMTLPAGFRANLFASEPDVTQPIAFAIDTRGRLWVAENHCYPNWLSKPNGPDRIVILEDSDGDGTQDKRTVFWEKEGANVSGIALGFGGAWVCATPNLLFIPDADGDDKPDGPPVVKLDGWDLKAAHNLFNALHWGPDGWLWGCNGIMSNSLVGAPGTPAEKRTPINCGVWKFHPTRGTFERVAQGTTNPWGLDFDSRGEAFLTNCVIPHLFRVIPGAHFQRMYGQDFNPYAYRLMETCADHLHWAGGAWTESREGKGHAKHGEAGGGHAHVGAMIYLGDNWPDEYRGSVFMNNIHGHRVNRDTLTRVGSGYVARHAPDFLMANDRWFRGMELKAGPDGGVFLTDWTDIGECHETDADLAHRENGRIYKLTHGKTRAPEPDLAGLGDAELARLQRHKNEWHARTARRILQERAASGKAMDDAVPILKGIFRDEPDEALKLRALWTLQATGVLGESDLLGDLLHENEAVRSWAIRLLGDEHAPSPDALRLFAGLAETDPSPLVRLNLASALQRLPVADRWAIAEGLVGHAEDAADASIPLMTWYGVEALVPADLPRAIDLASRCKIPLVRQFLARRAVDADISAALPPLVKLLEKSDDAARGELLAGVLEAMQGRKSVAMPAGWPALYTRLIDGRHRETATTLAMRFGDPRAVEALRAAVKSKAVPVDERKRALQTLVEARTAGFSADLHALLDDSDLRAPALRALAAFDDAKTPGIILGRYAKLDNAERDDAVATLAARPATALILLDAVAKGTIPRRDISTPVARQLQSFNNPQITEALEKNWGSVRAASADLPARMAKFKALLTPERIKEADASRGRLLFSRTCAQCHKLFDAGGDVGPELTGSDRANLDYVLGNVLDPSATVAGDYTLKIIGTNDGRVLSGIFRSQDEKAVVLQTANERIVIPRSDIEAFTPSTISMMPEGLFDRLSDAEVADLVAYLGAKAQVPLAVESK